MELASLASLAAIVSVVGGALVYLSKQLTAIKTLIYTRTDQLKEFFVSKLDYHEKHDDERFAALTRDIWEIRVANAARFGLNGDPKVITRAIGEKTPSGS